MRRTTIFFFSSFLILATASLIALAIGATSVPGLWGSIFHPFDTSHLGYQIIWQIRAPRIALALVVGASLGVGGLLAQGSTNNPLAEPSILGTSAGASLGVLVAILSGVAEIGSFLSVIFAAIGAFLITLLTFQLSRVKQGQSSLTLIVVGIAVSAVVTAIVGLIITITSSAEARSISFWSLGSLALSNSSTLLHLIPFFILATSLAIWSSKKLDLLSLGDVTAKHLGVEPERVRLGVFLILSLSVATAVSSVGSIAFLGLAAPHIARFIWGPHHQRLVYGSAFIGALLLLVADTVARSLIPPNELPIGLITSLIGAPILILLVRSRERIWQ